MQKTSQKKIAFLLTSLISGGEECNASILAKYLSKEVTVTCVCFNAPIDFELPANVPLKILRPVYASKWMRLLTLPLVLWRYWKFCKREGVTHSIAFDTIPNFMNCFLKLFGWQGKIYLRVTNHISTRFPATTFRGQLFQYLIKKLYPQATGIFVNAELLATELKTSFAIQVPVYLSYNPMDLSNIETSKVSDIATNKIFTFIHIAMFRPQKNHQLLIEAFAKIKHLKARLWLIGKGDLAQSLQALVERLGLTEQVHFLGFQQNYYQYVYASNCLVMSSDYEGQCRVLSEGLACGLPVISTDCPSGPRETIAPSTDPHKRTKETLEFAKYGILTPVGNADKLAEAMQYMYENNRYRKSDFFKERVKPFSVEKVVAKLLKDMNLGD